jgi:hypothetical protein
MSDNLLEKSDSFEEQKKKLLEFKKGNSASFEDLAKSFKAGDGMTMTVDTSNDAAISETFMNIRSPSC